MSFEVVIGCEVHVQLRTRSKAFCSCRNEFGGEPNTRVCPVCMGLPGALPVVNRALVDGAILAGLALNCDISSATKFDRKNYIYPDLPKGYQISQFDMPICTGGSLVVPSDEGEARRVRIVRLHAEEDAGKNIHSDKDESSFVDFNRCGTPLLEIVSEPDLRSPGEAVRYVQAIREIMRYIGVSDCNMEEASLRCDANINLWIYENDVRYATPIAEIKNMNSFRSIRMALEYEVRRQRSEWEEKRLTLEESGKSTRGYDESKGITVLHRSKEEAADYRYFPEPDLPPISIPESYVGEMRKRVGELPEAKRTRLVDQYGLTAEVAEKLTVTPALSDYFEEVQALLADPRKVANWMLSDVKKYLNAKSIDIESLEVSPAQMRELLLSVESGRISGKIAKEVFSEMADSGVGSDEIIVRKGLDQMSDPDQLAPIIQAVIDENGEIVDSYRSGKQNAIKFLMGQVMKRSRGKANPRLADELLRQRLGS